MELATALNNYAPPVVNTEGEPLKRRIADVAGARSLWFRMQQADIASNQQMAKVQAMVDGKEPYDPALLQKQGLGHMSNFNPGDAKAFLDTSIAAFMDLITGSESLIDVWTKYGEPSERQNLSQRISLHLSRTIRGWPEFFFRYAYIPHYRTLHGTGIAYFPDPNNWQWDVTSLSYLKIPRQTRTCEDSIQYAAMKKLEQPDVLMRYIQLGEYATEEGWNIPMLKRAMMNATPQLIDPFNWMEWEQRWKNNDLVLGETGPTVPLIYMWVRENDGRISLMIFAESALSTLNGEPEEFLFYRQGVFNCAQEAFIFFTRGIGTNATYHGVRGMGADMFNAFNQLMRLRNRAVDTAFAAGPTWQVESEEAVENFRIVPYGFGYLATPGATFIQQQPPNITNSLAPAIEMLQQTVATNIGQYTSTKTLDTGREISKFEAMARLDLNAQLSVTEINMFMQQFDRLCNQVVRRIMRPGYQRSDPGGHYVWEFKERCLEDGIPMEALEKLDLRYTRASRTIGSGSPAARRLSYESLMALYPYYDDYGKQQLVRLQTASVAGWDIANQLTTPPGADQRPPIDVAIAANQNASLAQGFNQPIAPNENKQAHLNAHINDPETGLVFYYQQFDAAGQNPALYEQIVPPMANIFDHAAQTLESYTGIDAPLFRQQLQQFNEIITNGNRHLQKAKAQQAEQAAAEGGQPAPQAQGPSDIEKMLAEWRVKMDQREEEFRMKMQQRQVEAAQKMALKQQEFAAEMSRKAASAQLQRAA